MGDPQAQFIGSNADVQSEILSLIGALQAGDPLAPVTLVVDSPAQGWALRRQLVCSLPAGAGIGNLRTLTVDELMEHIERACGLSIRGSASESLRTAVTEQVLRSQEGALAASREHPDTVLRLAALSDELKWCELGPDTDAIITAAGASATSTAAINFVPEVRAAWAAALGERPWPEAVDAMVARMREIPDLDLGAIIVTTVRVPSPVQRVLDSLGERATVIRVQPAATSNGTTPSLVIDCPDPALESALAVRAVAAAMHAGDQPAHMAIVYSTDKPYARLLEQALGDAGIEWHGPTGQTLLATATARYIGCLVNMAAIRVESGSGMTRPLLMRWFSLGTIHDGETRLSTGALRALIRQEGLYGDAANWRHRLQSLAEFASTEGLPEPEDAQASRRRRLAPYATTLLGVLNRLEMSLDAAAKASTWTDLGRELWSALKTYHLQGAWWRSSPEETASVQAIETLLLQSFPAIDEFLAGSEGAGLAPTVADAAQMITRALTDRRARHGSSAIGIHVGPLASTRGLCFDRVVIVGAAEGLLPSVRGDDPLLRDTTRKHLRGCPADLPTSLELEAATTSDVRALIGSSTRVLATYPRGALPGRAVALPSRYLAGAPTQRIGSSLGSLSIEPWPLADLDLSIRAGVGAPGPPANLAPLVESVQGWRHPDFDRAFGNPGPVDGQPAWSMADRSLSASAIEQFLHCPYHFFVQRVLGITTDEYVDDVDTLSPSDMGTLVHHVFERFVLASKEQGSLPDFGQSWPAGSIELLRGIMAKEVDSAEAIGLTGWRPAWERTRAQIDDSLPEFLAVDALEVRAVPAMQPVAGEVAFGEGSDHVVEVRVSADVVVRLLGSIDRVDISADGLAVGIVDYKTGKSDDVENKLGKILTRGPNKGQPRPRQMVQDLVYVMAARTLYPQAQRVDVTFFYVPNRGKGPVAIRPPLDEDRPGQLLALLTQLESAGASGSFEPRPAGRNDFCPVCRKLGRAASQAAKAAHGAPAAEGSDS
ncbi:MAG: hypothetical protein F2836_02015 [Actinobacteria bacterium]|uniref:Unannotated protein n=1 Tax=freshwater metagenome TaxID=449393 RepID=A0A6J7I2A2_9ZZZZ|nr:hypothetical protein [Actinomycetota bacterium]